MDLFSLASNLQQIAIGSVNFVNNKLRKKNYFTNYNYVTYIVIGEDENQPYDINMFFIPFQNSGKIKFKEFKEYFPFKNNAIFRFKLLLSDLIEIINDGLRSNLPLLKPKKEEDINLSNHIISDETEIKNILKQESLSYIWIDITNDEAFIPLYHGKIVAKVLFINNENYRSYDEIYFKNYKYDNLPIYRINDKYLCSYTFVKDQTGSKKSSIDDNGIMKNEDFDNDNENNKIASIQGNLMNINYSNGIREFDILSDDNDDDFKKKGENINLARKNGKRDILNEEYEKKYINEVDENENQNQNFFRNENDDQYFLKKSSSDVLNVSYEENRIGNINQNKNENFQDGKHMKKLFQKKRNDESNLEKNSYIPSRDLSSVHRSSRSKYDDSLSHKNIKKDQKMIKVNNRLKELKESRHQEEVKFKEKMLISENIKKQIHKWSKNSDDTYKDITVMLSTLNEVLWKDGEWKPIPMSDLISNPKIVKKTYKNAILLCHPDKHRDKSLEQVLRAEMIFQALNNAYKEKKNM